MLVVDASFGHLSAVNLTDFHLMSILRLILAVNRNGVEADYVDHLDSPLIVYREYHSSPVVVAWALVHNLMLD